MRHIGTDASKRKRDDAIGGSSKPARRRSAFVSGRSGFNEPLEAINGLGPLQEKRIGFESTGRAKANKAPALMIVSPFMKGSIDGNAVFIIAFHIKAVGINGLAKWAKASKKRTPHKATGAAGGDTASTHIENATVAHRVSSPVLLSRAA